MLRLTVIVASIACCSSFLVPPIALRSASQIGAKDVQQQLHMMTQHVEGDLVGDSASTYSGQVDRRTLLKAIPATLVAGVIGGVAATSAPQGALARSTPKPVPAGTKIVVIGGNGFVGSKVCEILVEAGAIVTSVSRSGSKPDKWAAGQSWVDKVSWTKGDPTTSDLSSVFGQASAVISCVGVIGGSDEEMEKGNGDVNVQAAMQAAKGKTGRFVYVSVSDLVPEAVGGAVFKGYFNGKSRAEKAIAESFPSTGVLIKPSFIYGGESFGLTPPRVSDGYGSGIDALLSSSPIRAIAGVSPGLIKVALSPPVSRDNVALACVAGALGRLQGTAFDGADEINDAASKA
ncbi:unnamed protein product [Hapterophycus canaliculatus]